MKGLVETICEGLLMSLLMHIILKIETQEEWSGLGFRRVFYLPTTERMKAK